MQGMLFLVGLYLASLSLLADANPMTYIHNAPESNLDKRYDFHWEILATALKKTSAEFGAFEIKSANESMTESRQVHELHKHDGVLNMIFMSTNKVMEADNALYPVRIPVDKGLSGYRVLLIRATDREVLRNVKYMDDLRKLTYGMGAQWLDNEVLKANSLVVVGGGSYDGLFDMLMDKRFDVFPRSAREIIGEYEQRKNTMPNLAIEDTLLLHYYWPMYFWFANTDEGRKLANRVEKGLHLMIKDGSYDFIFRKYFEGDILRLKLKQRIKNGRVFELTNPILPELTPVKNSSLWYRP